MLSNATECPLWPDKPNQCKTILILQKTFGSFSIIGCALVVSVIVILKRYKAFVQKLILTLSISAFLMTISYVIGDVHTENSARCRFQGFMMAFFDWATLLWVLIITINLLLIVKGKKHKEYLLWFHAIVWSTSLFCAVIPFFKDKYGPAGIWCWVKRDATTLRFGIWYVPLLILCLCMFCIYAYIIRYVWKDTNSYGGSYNDEEQINNKRKRDELRPLMAYPCIYIIFYIPLLMYRYDDAIHSGKPPNFSLTVICSIFGPSLGACYALAFALFNSTVHEITWLQIKQGFLNIVSIKPSHVIHKNYVVDEGPMSPSSTSNPQPAITTGVQQFSEFHNASYQNE